MEVVLLNSNPATIMTDKDIADRVYIEPLTVEVVEQLILEGKAGQRSSDPWRTGRSESCHGTGRKRLSGRNTRCV